MKQQAWEVRLNGKQIDIVFFNKQCDGGAPITAQDVKDSLVNHDGYNSAIVVRSWGK